MSCPPPGKPDFKTPCGPTRGGGYFCINDDAAIGDHQKGCDYWDKDGAKYTRGMAMPDNIKPNTYRKLNLFERGMASGVNYIYVAPLKYTDAINMKQLTELARGQPVEDDQGGLIVVGDSKQGPDIDAVQRVAEAYNEALTIKKPALEQAVALAREVQALPEAQRRRAPRLDARKTAAHLEQLDVLLQQFAAREKRPLEAWEKRINELEMIQVPDEEEIKQKMQQIRAVNAALFKEEEEEDAKEDNAGVASNPQKEDAGVASNAQKEDAGVASNAQKKRTQQELFTKRRERKKKEEEEKAKADKKVKKFTGTGARMATRLRRKKREAVQARLDEEKQEEDFETYVANLEASLDKTKAELRQALGAMASRTSAVNQGINEETERRYKMYTGFGFMALWWYMQKYLFGTKRDRKGEKYSGEPRLTATWSGYPTSFFRQNRDMMLKGGKDGTDDKFRWVGDKGENEVKHSESKVVAYSGRGPRFKDKGDAMGLYLYKRTWDDFKKLRVQKKKKAAEALKKQIEEHG